MILDFTSWFREPLSKTSQITEPHRKEMAKMKKDVVYLINKAIENKAPYLLIKIRYFFWWLFNGSTKAQEKLVTYFRDELERAREKNLDHREKIKEEVDNAKRSIEEITRQISNLEDEEEVKKEIASQLDRHLNTLKELYDMLEKEYRKIVVKDDEREKRPKREDMITSYENPLFERPSTGNIATPLKVLLSASRTKSIPEAVVGEADRLLEVMENKPLQYRMHERNFGRTLIKFSYGR